LSVLIFTLNYLSISATSPTGTATPTTAAKGAPPKVANVTKAPPAGTVGPKTNYEVDFYMNRGYSILTDQSAFIEKPSTVLAKYDIFDYKMDIDKMLNNNTIPNTLIFERSDRSKKQQKNS
jgi:hypothetical protein